MGAGSISVAVMTPDQERAAIVAWLRGLKKKADDNLQEAVDERNFEGVAALLVAVEFIPEIADAIERGDHKGE